MLDQLSNVVIRFINEDGITQMPPIWQASVINVFKQTFAEEIQEHQNLDYVNEYKQFYQFDETTVIKCKCLILSSICGLFQFLQIVSLHHSLVATL